MRVVHVQQQRLWAPIHGLLLGGALASLGLAPFIDDSLARWVLIAMAGLMVLIIVAFDRLHVMVTDEDLRAGFLVLRTRVRLADIEKIEVLPRISLWTFGGLGWRFSFRGEIGYIARPGPAIRIWAHSRRRPLVITCNRPDEVYAAVTQMQSKLSEEGSA